MKTPSSPATATAAQSDPTKQRRELHRTMQQNFWTKLTADDLVGAEEAYNDYKAEFPKYPYVDEYLYELRQKQNRPQEAYQIRKRMMHKQDDFALLHGDVGLVFDYSELAKKVGDEAESQKAIEILANRALSRTWGMMPALRILKHSPDADRALALVMSCGSDEQYYKRDFARYEEAVRLQPNNVSIMIHAAHFYFPSAYKQSLDLFREAYEKGDVNDRAWIEKNLYTYGGFHLNELLSGEYVNYIKK